ncbi:MAG: hypothetical protein MMC33_003913 [Icmadophila ericetorum]|nr:hypothetical protein [Icmadophila ericetorum]
MASPSASSSPSASASASSPPNYPTYRYQPRHPNFPYTPRDFQRQDSSPDPSFYSSSRFVTHIDDNAITLLRQYYAHNLPQTGKILDICSSWISHFPEDLEKRAVATARGEQLPKAGHDHGLHVVGMGMNKAELDANPILSSRILQDLNVDPTIPSHLAPLSASTCVVSIDYLTQPLSVLSSLHTLTAPGGRIHLTISNRCFPTKVVGRWLKVDEQERLMMVADYLWWSGWREVEIVTLCDGRGRVGGEDGGGAGGFAGFAEWFGGRPDPLWVVRGVKVGDDEY